ncbi:hypothetical protein LUZ62_053488 [Rhynchospora pubera]|uniref:Uncharacterized protein n=1 Tax=Rhynchospora pubera TaxID=906938 RepID=A0AAV8DQP4_9POAL|nr:hypothetical protein LUZ62_053488 [Rhynchospora pubera]
MTSWYQLRVRHRTMLTNLIQQGLLDSSYPAHVDAHPGDRVLSHQMMEELFGTAQLALSEMMWTVFNFGPINKTKMGNQLALIRGPSQYVGTPRVTNACLSLHAAYIENDRKRTIHCIMALRREINFVRPHLQALMELERAIWAASWF